ncbi:MAG: sulfurtransferase [Gemmatimonadaceae bacterium]|nr:sulfurtransferase [Gemmatimonadaceae bacterium]
MHTAPIISAEALRTALASSDDIVLLDAGRTRAAWAQGHLHGARYANCDEHLSSASLPGHDPARGGRHPLPSLDDWCRTLGEWGIAPSTRVVVYDEQAGANSASRAWWMLRSVGHEHVAVLDGGLPAAVAAGLVLTTAPAELSSLPPYPGKRWLLPVVDIGETDALRTNPAWRVIDVRSARRFAGLEEPLDPIAGHIPGAINVPYTENLEAGRFKSPDDLRRMYEERLEGVGGDRVVVHCGSGVTACHTLLALEIAGIRGASLYVGSWSEWCRSPLPRASASDTDVA